MKYHRNSSMACNKLDVSTKLSYSGVKLHYQAPLDFNSVFYRNQSWHDNICCLRGDDRRYGLANSSNGTRYVSTNAIRRRREIRRRQVKRRRQEFRRWLKDLTTNQTLNEHFTMSPGSVTSTSTVIALAPVSKNRNQNIRKQDIYTPASRQITPCIQQNAEFSLQLLSHTASQDIVSSHNPAIDTVIKNRSSPSWIGSLQATVMHLHSKHVQHSSSQDRLCC